MEYEKYLEKNRDAMIASLQKVIRINSEEKDQVTDSDGRIYPFGAGVQEALEATLEIGRQLGFEVRNVDNYGGHIDLPGKNGKIMAIIGHLDVVPAGSGWGHEPYGGEIADGKMYGRGTLDDKGPVISCLYAMKALKDAGFVPEPTVRLILGLDEESGWKGIKYYFEKEKRPDYGFTPDADFPLINGEKGLMIFGLAKKFGKFSAEGLTLRSLKGGNAPNSVADFCRVVVNNTKGDGYQGVKEAVARYREETGHKINCRGAGKAMEITVSGISAHGAAPEKGLNAISVMMDFLGRLTFVNEDQNDFIEFYNKYIGFCLKGENLGIDFRDDISGNLVFNVGMAEIDGEMGSLTINIRYPVSGSAQQVYDAMEPVLSDYNIGLVKAEDKEPIYIDADSPIVKTLMSVYRENTGDEKSQPLVIGGGTYARATPGVIAFGALFPGDEDLMHQKDECIRLERLDLMTKIYTEAIYKLASEDYNI